LSYVGWIEDLAKDHGHKSLRALALAVHKSPLRPKDDDRSGETIANKLRDADKGNDVVWWTGKGRGLLPALADALSMDEEDLVERLQADSSGEVEGDALCTFKMFPALRAIDLRTDGLFPGIPDEIVHPGGPRAERTWWVAPAGAGKTIVGRWLERFGWTRRQADRWTEIDLPDRGRVFVELASTDDVSIDALRALPKAVKICVAAPRPPRGAAGDALTAPMMWADAAPLESMARGNAAPAPPIGQKEGEVADGPPLQIVASPPPHAWVGALIEWAAERVRPGGGFDVERVRRMFVDKRLVALFETPGVLIEFLGMVDQVGVDKLEDARRARDSLAWIRVWLRAALERPDRRRLAGIADLLEKRGPEIMVRMEIERLRRGLGSSLPEPTWIELVPRTQAPDLDRDRLLALVDQGGSDALVQVRAMLAPDAASVVQGLQAIGALTHADAGRLALRPAWVATLVANAAIEQLDDDGPDGLGTLLLFKGTSEAALRRLIDQVREGKLERVEACVAAATAQPPERMVALDGAFRAIGLALMAGADVPLPLVRAAWDRQLPHLFRRFNNWPPVPLLSVAAQDPWKGVTTNGAWFAAAFAISRALFDAGVDVGRSALNPWGGLPEEASELQACEEALISAAIAFQVAEGLADPDPLRRGLHSLGGDLLDRHGIVRRFGEIVDIQGPDLLVVLATGGELEISKQEHKELLQLHFGLDLLEDACRRRKAKLEEVLAWCWRTWGNEVGQWPPTEWPRRDAPQWSERIWASAPASPPSEKLYSALLVRRPETWRFLPEHVWVRWLEGLRSPAERLPDEAFRQMPERVVLKAIREQRTNLWSRDLRRILWDRMPDSLLRLIDELSAAPPTPDLRFKEGPIPALVYDAVPDAHCRVLLERARTWLASPASYPGIGEWLRRWLVHVVEQRAPGWRDAYVLLTEPPC
jgi:hypothetical protein